MSYSICYDDVWLLCPGVLPAVQLFNFYVLVFLFVFLHRVFYYLRLLPVDRIWTVTLFECSVLWSFLFLLIHFYSPSRMRDSSSSPHCTKQAFGAVRTVAMNVWEMFRWDKHAHAEIAYKKESGIIYFEEMNASRENSWGFITNCEGAPHLNRTSHSGFAVCLFFLFNYFEGKRATYPAFQECPDLLYAFGKSTA